MFATWFSEKGEGQVSGSRTFALISYVLARGGRVLYFVFYTLGVEFKWVIGNRFKELTWVESM